MADSRFVNVSEEVINAAMKENSIAKRTKYDVNLLKLPAYLHSGYQCSYKNICTMLSLFTEFTKEFERN